MLQAFVSLRKEQPPRTESGLQSFFEKLVSATFGPPTFFCTNVDATPTEYSAEAVTKACMAQKCKFAVLRGEEPFFWQATVLMPDKKGLAAMFFQLEPEEGGDVQVENLTTFAKNLYKAVEPRIIRIGDNEAREKLKSRHGLVLMPGLGRIEWLQIVHPDVYGELYNPSELVAAPAFETEIWEDGALYLRVYGDPKDWDNEENISLANFIPGFLAGTANVQDGEKEKQNVRTIEKLWNRANKTAERAAKIFDPPGADGGGAAKKKTTKKPVAKAEKPKAEKPKKKEAPKADAPKVEKPKAEAPKEEPKAEAPKEEPKTEAPKDEPKAEAPKEEPKAEAPKEEPKAEAPKEEPKEEPKADEPSDLPAAKTEAGDDLPSAKSGKKKKKKKKKKAEAVAAADAPPSDDSAGDDLPAAKTDAEPEKAEASDEDLPATKTAKKKKKKKKAKKKSAPTAEDIAKAVADDGEVSIESGSVETVAKSGLSQPLYSAKDKESDSKIFIGYSADDEKVRLLDKLEDFAAFLQGEDVKVEENDQERIVSCIQKYHRPYLNYIEATSEIPSPESKDPRLGEFKRQVKAAYFDEADETSQLHVWAFNPRNSSLEEIIVRQFADWPLTMEVKRHLLDLKEPEPEAPADDKKKKKEDDEDQPDPPPRRTWLLLALLAVIAAAVIVYFVVFGGDPSKLTGK